MPNNNRTKNDSDKYIGWPENVCKKNSEKKIVLTDVKICKTENNFHCSFPVLGVTRKSN